MKGVDDTAVVHVVDCFHQSITILVGDEERNIDVTDLSLGE